MAGSSTGALGRQKGIRMGGEPRAGAGDPAGWDGPQQGTHPEWVSEPEEGEELPTEAGIGGKCGAGGWSTDKEECPGGRVVLQAEMCPAHPYPHPHSNGQVLITSTSDWDCIWR